MTECLSVVLTAPKTLELSTKKKPESIGPNGEVKHFPNQFDY